MKRIGIVTSLCLLCLVIYASAEEENKEEHALTGIWEVQKITVDKKEDGGEAGAYWIFRADGTFKIVKRGRKPEGKWTLTPGNRLTLTIEGKAILDGARTVKKETLVIQAKQGEDILEFTFVKRDLKEEPSEPRNS